ncbi:MAG: class I adenylate-forming enzyme family protein [Sphingomicrobium sp.]
MPSELDRRYDAVLAGVTGPGGMLALGTDKKGQAIVTNFPDTLPGLIRTFAAANAEFEAIVAGDERLMFPDLDTLSERVARALVARGIEKGDRVGIAMRNCPAWVVLYMGIVKAGAIATLFNGWWESHELEHALQLTEPKLIFADMPRSDRIHAASVECQVMALAIELPIGDALAELFDSDDPAIVLPRVDPDDDATILFTSGSTGEAKGAVSSHRAVTTGAYTYAAGLITMLGLLTQDGRAPATKPRVLLSVPLFHVTGEVPVMLTSFVIGRCLVMMPKWDAGEALRLIQKEKVTYFVGVPTMSLELMTHPAHDNYDLSSLTDIAAGGAPRPTSHVTRLQETFPLAKPALGYGLTETNAVGAHNFWGNYAAKPASTGRAHAPFVELAILGVGDTHLQRGETGEIGIRTAANIRGYWRAKEATEALYTDDHFIRTGDIGYLDEDGYLFIVDRKKEIIIRGGENIAAAEVEAACYAHPDVAEASVFGAPDERLGEVPVAIIHAAPGATFTPDDLKAFLAGRLARFKIPERFVFVAEELPKLGTGKIDRRALKARFGS